MDLKQIEYIVKIAETGNITRAAEQLFVTQSALNQQLLKLENALGIKLFYRRKHDLTPTDAGKVYLKYGRQMLIEKREAYNIINDLAQDNLGHLSFTFSRERGLDMFVATYPAFHRQFPGIIVEPHEMRVHNQQLQIAQGYVDLGLVTLSEQQKLADLQYDHIRIWTYQQSRSCPLCSSTRNRPCEASSTGSSGQLRSVPMSFLNQAASAPC